jgi:HD-like signal output (HDOD) protein/CheY-like chemotaxis protein
VKKRILFVDDEPNILHGLQRMLRPKREEWEMDFAEGGLKALELLLQKPFDVIVSDMRMPGLSGVQLLNEVRESYPQMVRIVLSGHSELETILKSIRLAHQYLAKPCELETITTTISRACALSEKLSDESLKRIVAKMDSLPSLPAIYEELIREIESEEGSVDKIGKIIATDVGMTAKILQLVNSAFFGLRRQVVNPGQAATLLGLETLKTLILSVHIFSQMEMSPVFQPFFSQLWDHSLKVAGLSKKIAALETRSDEIIESAFMAGMLHDCGKLVLIANFPNFYAGILNRQEAHGRFSWELEEEVFTTNHSAVGSYLLGLWGLPNPIVESVAFHHHPVEFEHQEFMSLTAVHLADAFCQAEFNPPASQRRTLLDQGYLEKLNLADRLAVYREMAESLQSEGEGHG